MHRKFWGWYFKCQSDGQTLAVIPALHREGGEKSCSIQVITDHGSWNVRYPYSAYRRHDSAIQLAGSMFGRQGVFLDIHSPRLRAVGYLSFSGLTPIRYDIMGPFRWVPFMECRHSVFSMQHTVTGELEINGAVYVFDKGRGYWEGDRGISFPKEYAWTQCLLPEGSVMLSVADIPLGRRYFTGVIAVVFWQGKEYRLATYLGAKAVRIEDGEIIIRQGRKCLTVRLLERLAHPLRAPDLGAMSRTIHENASCKAFYQFQEDGRTLFAREVPNASFEYEYPW